MSRVAGLVTFVLTFWASLAAAQSTTTGPQACLALRDLQMPGFALSDITVQWSLTAPVAQPGLTPLPARRYRHADVLWRATLRMAADVSRAQTASIGCRSLDVLHVATALQLGLRRFVTFDRRQQDLARAVGLTIISAD